MTIFYNLSKFHLILTAVMHVMNSFLTYLRFFEILLRNAGRGVNYAQGLGSGRVNSLDETRYFVLLVPDNWAVSMLGNVQVDFVAYAT